MRQAAYACAFVGVKLLGLGMEREREMGVGGYSTQNGKNAPWAE